MLHIPSISSICFTLSFVPMLLIAAEPIRAQEVHWTLTNKYKDWGLWTHTDPIDETKDYFIATEAYARTSESTLLRHMGKVSTATLLVFCSGYIQISFKGHYVPVDKYKMQEHTLRAKWSSMKTTAHRGLRVLAPEKPIMVKDLIVLGLPNTYSYSISSSPSIRQRMLDNNKVMLEVEVGERYGNILSYYTFSLIGFTKADEARLAKGCTSILVK